MTIFRREPPDSWTFADFQNAEQIHALLEGEAGTRIAHRPNRLVLFKSNLFHATDRGSFQEGYSNRRINFTFLFGQRGLACPGEGREQAAAGARPGDEL